jgi:hypothetical protein
MIARVRKVRLVALTAVLAWAAAMVACGSQELAAASFGGPDSGRGDAGSADGSAFGDAGASPPPFESGVFFVHAAAFPAFRVCFSGSPDELPMPSRDVMPEANVAGVDVGSIVRLDPIGGPLGHALLFEESALRVFYPTATGAGPTCAELLGASNPPPSIDLGELDVDVRSGVHVLALTGCRSASDDPVASKARCGASWDAAKGNLAFVHTEIPVQGGRGDDQHLPVQVLQLSSALEGLAGDRAIGVAFGELTPDGGPAAEPFVDDVPFGSPAPSAPAVLPFDGLDTAAYASRGFLLTLGAPGSAGGGGGDAAAPDAGARELVLAQSLADVQRLSDPSFIPSAWYAAGSSYVLLLVGDPAPALADGGPDTDSRRALHFLSVPLADLTAEAGAL